MPMSPRARVHGHRLVGALVLAIVALGLPSPTVSGVRAASPVGVGDIVAGVANRSSVHLSATYVTRLKLNWAAHRISVRATLSISNTSGGPIDRIELNTIAARLGAMRLDPVTVDGVAVKATVSDQTIVVPLGGVLPAGGSTTIGVRYLATLRTSLGGSNWLFTKANGIVDLYRWLPWVSRKTPFNRPNHGDPFVTPSSPSVRVTIVTTRKLVLATSGNRVATSADGLTKVYEATNVRDFTVTAAADYRTRERIVGDNIVRVYYRPGAPGAAMLDGAADAFKSYEARLGAYPHKVFKVVQSAGAFGMESPGLIWIPTGVNRSNLRYLTAHETAHQWFYGIVGNDQAREPFTDEAAADFMARYVTGLKRSSRCAAGRLDLSIYKYTTNCYYEKVYIQGGNILDSARKRMGSTAFWAAMRGYVSAHRFGLSSTKALLQALDDGTPKDLSTLFAPRFPRIY
jgi:aminopeptidase N